MKLAYYFLIKIDNSVDLKSIHHPTNKKPQEKEN